MNLLNAICSYWYECIKNEDVLEKDISINVRSRAILYPLDNDPFIFSKKDNRVKITDEKLNTFASAKTEGLEFFYGYPLLYYKYRDRGVFKHVVAPLFIIKVKFSRDGEDLFLSKDEAYPVCGIQALTKLELKTEEIAEINQSVENLFFCNPCINEQELANQVLEIIKKERSISINEEIKPSQLSNSKKLTREMTAGLYNKSLIFTGETTVFNIHLIKDLLELKSRDNLDKTSLSFFSTPRTADVQNEVIPILPFPSNEYQITAIRDIFKHSLSVITGPPGTGKSQFISNLIINLFLSGKSVLFVSHTGEAVDVVNSRINEQFRNLMLRTGKKAIKQDLRGKFNELVTEHRRDRYVDSIDNIHTVWKMILDYRASLLKRDELEKDFQSNFFIHKRQKERLQIQLFILKRIKIYFDLFILSFKLKTIKAKLKKLLMRTEIEAKIRELEKDYYASCQVFVRGIYLEKMLGNGENTGAVNTFLNQVHWHRAGSNNISESSFINAMKTLSVWACTLKSLGGTFPLKAGVFDYVIFDEASQIDLPSAAPALYRAKKAIIVGDQMQLTHIAGITLNTDFGLARTQGLTEMKDLYPDKIRYCDVSLYKAAENFLPHNQILLKNHYRSEDQIISLCNQVFYKGRLKILSTLDYGKFPSSLPLGVQWEDIKGEVYKLPSGSRVNQQEVDVVSKIFQEIWAKISNTNLTIGVVTPYNGQRHAIFQKIQSLVPQDVLEKRIRIFTAHQFQGSEADIIIFSLVISKHGNGNSDKWYNIYPQILNVALSRARYLLYIVGDKDFCKNRPDFEDFYKSRPIFLGKENILRRINSVYNKIKDEEKIEEYYFKEKFDTRLEFRFFKEALQKIEIELEKFGYKLVPKYVAKRYTLDFALIGNKKIDIEIDGTQHEIIGGMPVLEDIERDKFLREKEGWKILRFPNYRVLSEIPKIIEELLIEL